jgi:hypothetical protein
MTTETVTAPSLEDKVNEIYAIIQRIEPIITTIEKELPGIVDKIGPIIDGVSSNPMLKMLGLGR